MEMSQIAYVLHSRPYRESSALVTFFTPEQGKLTGVVRGVRGRSKSSAQKNALLQPFQKLNLQWNEKPQSTSDLVSIRGLEPEPVRFFLEGEASFCGLYLNEVLYRLLYPRVPADTLFLEYEQTLLSLLSSAERPQQAWLLRRFEMHLLHELGVSLHLEHDAFQQPIEPELSYEYYVESGAYPVSDSTRLEPGIPISGECLLKLQSDTFCQACLPEWKRLLRQVLRRYLGSKPIAARQLFI